jgi:uncharacterized membrane protein
VVDEARPGRPIRPLGAGRPVSPTRPPQRRTGLDTPLESRRPVLTAPQFDPELVGRWSERFARFLGTAQFLAGMTVFVVVWLAWNTFAPAHLQFDPRSLNYTLLTLILSLQASYAAPLILLAQNRQADRDRVAFEQDRQRGERALADTEYLAREVAALRITMREVATRDYVRSELRDLLEELLEELPERTAERASDRAAEQPPDQPRRKVRRKAPPPEGARPEGSGDGSVRAARSAD